MTVLRYTTASDTWLDRLPLGDGRVGVMVGADASARRLGLNEATAWSGGLASADRDLVDPASAAEALAAARAAVSAEDPQRAETAMRALQHGYAQAFLPVGEVTITTAGHPDRSPEIIRELDLDTAVHVCRAEGVTATSIVSWHSGLIVHRESYARPTDAVVSFDTPLRRVDEERADARAVVVLDLPADVAPTHEPDAPAVTWEADDVSTGTVVVIVDVEHDGAARWSGGDLVVSGANRLDIRIALTTTIRGVAAPPEPREKARSRAEVLLAVADSREAIDRHEHAFRASASNFDFELAGDLKVIGDPHRAIIEAERRDVLPTGVLSALISYGVYLLRCASTETGPPANLQGIWNAQMQPPWSSAYTLNINLPMNYWAAESVGLSGPHTALLNLIEGLANRGRDTARRLYGIEGWVSHHNTDLWAYTLPTAGDAAWSHWPLGGAWLVRQFDEQRRHGDMTPEVRARFRPVARDCARFLLGWLRTDANGAATTSPSTSPENRYLVGGRPVALTEGSALDLALIREVLRLVIDLADDAGEPEDPVAAAAREALPRLAPARVQADGRILEWGSEVEDEDRAHRHLSHLYEWYPGDGGRDDLHAAVAHTLDTRGDDSTGWSLAWKIALRARLGDAAAVSRLLRLAMRAASPEGGHRGGLYPNLFAAHPPYQIDGNFGLVSGVLEALVQSHRLGRIDLLPALPAEMGTGRVRGLIARPGIRLDLDWCDGEPVALTLEAVKPSTAGPVTIAHGSRRAVIDVPARGVIEVPLPLPLPPTTPIDRSTA